jgi:uncharacterized membrane protein YdjX (TVP38/TMEM64 family)
MSDSPPQRRTAWPRVVVAVAVLALLVLGGRQLGALLPAVTARVAALGAWGPVAFIAVYAAACVALVPASLLTVAAGAVFGVIPGTLYVLIGATIGATLAFLLARTVARAAVAQRVEADPRFAAIDRGIAADGRRVAFLLRLSPLIPFNLLNYALGLTKIRLADYVIACIGMAPGTLLYVYTGHVAGTVAGAASGAPSAQGPARYIILGVGLVATAAVTLLLTRLARRALSNDIPTPP